MRIVDTHHHLWDIDKHDYPWLRDTEPKPYGDYSALLRNYLIEDFRNDIGDVPVIRSVHLNAGMDPLQETAWLQAIADDTARSGGFPHGIVGTANFLSPTIEADLEFHASHRNMRGIRQILSGVITSHHADPTGSPRWHESVGLLSRHGLSFDMQIHPYQMPFTVGCAKARSDLLFVIDHGGLLNYTSEAETDRWRRGIRALAELPNVRMKISALMMYDLHWTADSVRPFIREMVEAFGVDRCFFGSNFPVDSLSRDYGSLWANYIAATDFLSEDERDRVFFRNAVATYRLEG
jgi:predicted TIM-barrel fold metal-dependent hydrolase